jgi:hypothetical protein
MSRKWDIVEAERLFETDKRITHPLASKGRLIPDASSMVKLGVIVGMMAASTLVSDRPMPFDQFGNTSDLRVVVQRSSIPVRKGPERVKPPGIDFSRGRSPQQLANSFRGLFGPATDIDDLSDEGFVFR